MTYPEPKIPHDEAANWWTHAAGAVLAAIGAAAILLAAAGRSLDLIICLAVYAGSFLATLSCSAASHFYRDPRRRFWYRAADQAAIYAMIAGTYTPLIYRYCPRERAILLAAMWLAAGFGIWSKLGLKHRVEGISTVTYLLLGWVPGIWLLPAIPPGCRAGILIGGVVYSIGVIFLTLDNRYRYFHAIWHVFVIAAALVHYITIYQWVL